MVLSLLKELKKSIDVNKILEKESEDIPEMRKVYTERICKLREIQIDCLLKQLQSNLDKRFYKQKQDVNIFVSRVNKTSE